MALQQGGQDGGGALQDLVLERTSSLSGFLLKQSRSLVELPWQLVQVYVISACRAADYNYHCG